MEKYNSLLAFSTSGQEGKLPLHIYKDKIVLFTLTPTVDIQSILFSMKVDTFILIVVERGAC